MLKINIKYFFCESFVFKKGEWHGIFPFEAEYEEQTFPCKMYVTYKQQKRATLFKRFSFPLSLPKEASHRIETLLTPLLEQQMAELKTLFIEPREIYIAKPKISRFRFHDKQSDDSTWHFSFHLFVSYGAKSNATSEPFKLKLEKKEGMWHYTFSPSKGSLPSFKNSMKWEDYLMDAVIEHIHKTPEIRFKFLNEKVRYKYKK